MTVAYAPSLHEAGQRVLPRDEPATIVFRVSGKPATQGSMRAFVKAGRAVVTHDNAEGLDSWRGIVRMAAAAAMKGRAPFRGPIGVRLLFALKKPKRHTGTSPYQHVRPDVDRLSRSILDALTSVCFEDDSQVSLLLAEKRYAPGAWNGVEVIVKELRER